MQTRAPIAQLDQVNKIFRDFWYRPRVHAVRDLTFDIQPGEVFGLIGPNGSGKSTTIKMLLGLLKPSSGQISVLGASPHDVKTKAKVGYLPEHSWLYDYLTAEETLHFFGKLFNLPNATRKKRVEELLHMIGMEHTRHRRVGEFSKGMARRIGLAQALINDPDLIILDEPTSGLDPLGCHQVKELILTLKQRGKTVLLSSHNLADVEEVCDRIAILFDGQRQACGSVEELLSCRERIRLTLPVADDLEVRKLVEELQTRFGSTIETDTPRRSLETFFIETVEQANLTNKNPSGTAPTGGAAAFLKGDDQA